MKGKFIVAGVGFFGIWLVLCGQSYAQDSTEELFACVNKSSGAVKFVAAGTVCGNGWTLFTWNVAGPQGPQGPQGPSGGLRVVDNLGREVGTLLDTSGLLARKVGSLLAIFLANAGGFVEVRNLQFYHIGHDCSGTRYAAYVTSDFSEPPGFSLVRNAMQHNSTIVFAGNPVQSFDHSVSFSIEEINPADDISQPGICFPDAASGAIVGPPVIVDLSFLQLPFRVE